MTVRRRWVRLTFLGLLCCSALSARGPCQRALNAEQPVAPPLHEAGVEDCPEDPPTPIVAIRVRVPACAEAGQELEYHICVENQSAAAAHHVLVRNPLPAHARFVRAQPEPTSKEPELIWQLGTLEACACREIVLVFSATGTGDIENCARVQFEHGQCVCTKIVRPPVAVAEAKMTLAKTGPQRRYVNLPAAYQLTVTNTGTAPLDNVVITDPLPAETTFVSASNGGRLDNDQVRWQIGGLAPGASRTVDVVLRARKAGRICNRASATADRGLTAQAEACTDFMGVSALLLEVVDTDDPVEVGGETSYVILVRNQGSVPATRVVIDARVPEPLTVVRVTGPADHRKDAQRVVFEPFTLEAQNTARFVVYVKALRPADVRFKVDLTADQLTAGPVHEEESTTIYADIPP